MNPSENNTGIELSIIMPCLNEAETLERCIQKAKRFISTHQINGEIIIGDNGSTDGSLDIARREQVRIVNVPVRGYGAALYYASMEAHGKYLIMGDSDDSYDFSNLMPFVEKLREGYDLVMGNRFKGGIAPGAMPWKNRYIGNPVLSTVGRILFKSDIRDFHCGIRGFSKEAFLKMDLRTTGMEYASEMVIKSTLLKLKIIEVPTTLDKDGRSRPPHLRPWRDGWRHLRFMLLYSPNWLFIYPGAIGMIAGIFLSVWLLTGMKTIGTLHIDIHTLLYASALILVGFNCIAFGIYAKIFTARQNLIPESKNTEKFIKNFKLEQGLILGAVIFLTGLAGSLYAIASWREKDFGVLNPTDTMRVVIPSITLITLGIQIIFSSFFYSILFLNTRK